MPAKGILKVFKPKSLLDYWTAAMFLAAVIRLFIIKGLDPRTLLLFLVPPLIALANKAFSDRLSTRVLGAVFLTLIGFGVALGRVRSLFPNLCGVDPELSATDNRILTWYAIVYVLYLFSVVPLVLFIRGLIDHRRKRKAEFTKFTCILGLIAELIVGPGMFAVCATTLGLLPVYRSTSDAKPDTPDHRLPDTEQPPEELPEEGSVPPPDTPR